MTNANKPILALKKEMKHKGITQDDIAEKLGIKQSNISLILSGKRVPRIDTFNNIAGVLNMELVVEKKKQKKTCQYKNND
ncbi:MAG: XRE family transcriptional regulator [Spirochaetes bacterium]|nr:MAG: XRE family transcriptional regulator [Spirochaetota bacterium]